MMPLYTLGELTPDCDADVWIAPGAHVIGAVHLSAGVGIWFNCTLRGDNELLSIGANSNVQENCVFHTDPGYPLTIGAGCTIGHKVMLHGCTIGDNSLIGMGATVLNGATIGRNCLIGAGALITEGKVIPDNSLVMGAPGKVVRQIDDAGVRMLESSARRYVENMQRFRDGLRVVS